MTTTRQDGSVGTSEATLFPTTASQASSNSAHPVPVGTLIGIVGGIIALLVFLLFLFLYHRRQKALALMGLGGSNVTQSKHIEFCHSSISLITCRLFVRHVPKSHHCANPFYSSAIAFVVCGFKRDPFFISTPAILRNVRESLTPTNPYQ